MEYEYCIGRALAVGGLGGIFLSHSRRWSSGDYGFWPRSARRGSLRAGQAWRGLCVRHCLNLSVHKHLRVQASKSESELRDVRSPSGARNSPPRASHVSGTPAGKHVVPMIPMGPPHCHCVATASGDLLLLGTSTGTTTFLNAISENLRRNSKNVAIMPGHVSLGAKSPVGEGERGRGEGLVRLTLWWYLHFLSFYSNFTYLQFALM